MLCFTHSTILLDSRLRGNDGEDRERVSKRFFISFPDDAT
jgi:hypothetical protein